MPDKETIKANKAEAKALRKTLTATHRLNAKECTKFRQLIRKYQKDLENAEKKHGDYTAKVNRRLAILEGRNQA